jgi:hypothetical protein
LKQRQGESSRLLELLQFYLCFVLQEREVAKVGEVCVQFNFLFVCYIVAEREFAGAWEQVREGLLEQERVVSLALNFDVDPLYE